MLFLPTDCEASPEEGVIRQAMANLVTGDDADEFDDHDFADLFVWQDGDEVVVSLDTHVIGRHVNGRDALIEASHQLWKLSRKVEAAAMKIK
jgi:hypothetical protein